VAIWLDQADLENATSVQSVIACCDDTNVGVADPAIIASIIDRAEQEILSYLVGEYGPGPISATVMAQLEADNFLKYCALDYAVAFMYDRHPEAVPTDRGNDIQARKKSANEKMQRVMDARQRAPTVATPPANVGGVSTPVIDRVYISGPGARRNHGDY
jgi:hypothetical protein